MPITPSDLLAPVGPVERTLFPGEDIPTSGDPTITVLEERLQTYIDRAYAKIDGLEFSRPDDAARAWSLHLTFKAAYIFASSRPATENSMVPVLGSESYQKDQRDALRELSEEYLDEYDSLKAELPTVTQPHGIPTRQITNKFEW